jgi:hypothetical protein
MSEKQIIGAAGGKKIYEDICAPCFFDADLEAVLFPLENNFIY